VRQLAQRGRGIVAPVTFRRALGPFDATMIVIGGIVGSGIFINPYLVARTLDSSVLVLAAWIAGGAIALVGAFAYAELGGVFPSTGGQYVYLRDGWHPLAGFLYGLIEALVTALVGSTYTQIVAFSVVIAALAVMPNGLLGRAAAKKV